MRLKGGTYQLVLQRSQDGRRRFLYACADFQKALKYWTAGTRVSPIFPLEAAPLPQFDVNEGCWVLFFGPLYPAGVAFPRESSVYLSLGLYNLIVITANAKDRNAARRLPRTHCVCWEEWRVEQHRVRQVREGKPEGPNTASPQGSAKPIPVGVPTFRAAKQEYVALMASTTAKARHYFAENVADLSTFDRILRNHVTNSDLDVTYRHRLLVNTNAALSRHASQTYAGTSPICETECPISTHSLLGIGIASIALVRMRRFLQRAFEQAQLLQRINLIREFDAAPRPLESISPADPFWGRDFLNPPTFIAQDTNDNAELVDATVPLITCYSGRDGFRSTELSLSAPLEVVSSCDTVAWTPLTLTHEVSHTIIDGVLGVLLPKPPDPDDLEEHVQLMDSPSAAQNLFDQLKAFLCFGIWKMDSQSSAMAAEHNTMSQSDIETSISAHELSKYIYERSREVNEILTHCFDFLYFYRQDPDKYIRTIWASWDMIPNVRPRTRDYIIRSLCALHSTNLRRGNGPDTTVDLFVTCLGQTQREFSDSRFVCDALAEIQQQRETYLKLLKSRAILVKFVKQFLYSPSIQKFFEHDPSLTHGGRDGYTVHWHEFPHEQVCNPLRFAEAFSNRRRSQQVSAAWMMHQLAFGERE